MGKKRVTVIGSEDESELKNKRAIQLEQKKLREGKSTSKASESTSPKNTDELVPTPAESEDIQAEQNLASPTETKPSNSSSKKLRVRSPGYVKAKSMIQAEKYYTLPEALDLLHQVSYSKFDPSVELHIVLKSGTFNQTIPLPFSNGKTKTYAVANDQTLALIDAGKFDFDVLVASPAQMAKLVKYAKTLGPKGLMPNPKNGTVVPNPEETIQKMSNTISVVLKTDKNAPIIHTVVGKLSQKPEQLTKNVQAIINALPNTNIRKIVIKSSMSPAIKLSI